MLREDHGGGRCGQMPLRAVSLGAAAFICSERMWPKRRYEARETRPHLSKTTNKKKGPATLGDAASPAKVQTGTLL